MDIEIKKADISDIKALMDINKRAFKPLYQKYKDTSSPYLQSEEHFRLRILYEEGCYYKILCDNELCGGAFVYKKDGFYRLGTIYIDPEYQNRKIGQTAISLIFEQHPSVKHWELDVPIDQISNIKCYTKMGFRDTGKREKINDKLMLAYFERKIT